MPSNRYIGLMSGTSLDGVDAAVAEFTAGPAAQLDLLATRFEPFPDDLRDELLALHLSSTDELHRAALVSGQLARAYAATVKSLLIESGIEAATIAAIGCHGQTVRHHPEQGYTLQLNNPALLAELTGITVVADFRSRDIAAGGQGAPLATGLHAWRFRSPSVERVALNLGGIANVTLLPRDAAAPVIGFDTGPANLLMDAWAKRHLRSNLDQGGAWAAGGSVDAALLAAMLADPWLAQSPPKSTGRDYFNMAWLEAKDVARLRPVDVQATLAEFTAASVAEAVARWCPGAREVIACGGGVHNADLMHRLGTRLGGVSLQTSEALGLHPDWVEAAAFAWLARQAMQGQPGNLPSVTGAHGPRVLGAIYPR